MIQAIKTTRNPIASLAKSSKPIISALEPITCRNFTITQSLTTKQPSHLIQLIFLAVKKLPLAKNRSSLLKTKAPAKNNPTLINPNIRRGDGMVRAEEYDEKGGHDMLPGEMSVQPTRLDRKIKLNTTTQTTAKPISILITQMTFRTRFNRRLVLGAISFEFMAQRIHPSIPLVKYFLLINNKYLFFSMIYSGLRRNGFPRESCDFQINPALTARRGSGLMPDPLRVNLCTPF